MGMLSIFDEILSRDMKENFKVMIFSNTAWYLANFRSNLIRALLLRGYEVVAVAPADEHVQRIEALGCRFLPVKMANASTNPFSDILLSLQLLIIFIREQPSVFLGYTVKPNVYGGLIARLLSVPAVNNIAGLGTAFISENWITRVVEGLYRFGLEKAVKVFFQNSDDLELFLERGLVRKERIDLIPGSGVDINWFSPAYRPPKIENGSSSMSKDCVVFLLPARLLWDKGVGEFVTAARKLVSEGARAEFQLLGFLDAKNRTAISQAQIDAWVSEGVVSYLGVMTDVRPAIAQADCVVLPSYREGVPRSLLEAASMGKPLITTDAIGCREVVDDGVTGLLCMLKSSEDLAAKMKLFLTMSPDSRRLMGHHGREKILKEFDERIVIDRYLSTLQQIRDSRG